MKIGFFCSNQIKLNDEQYSELDMLLKSLNHSKYAVLYGGSEKGIMGQVGQSAIAHKLPLVAVDFSGFNDSQYPQAHVKLYKNFIQREYALINNVDVAVVLPGGYGALMELFWLVTMNNIHETHKKIIIWNMDNYYTQILDFLESENFQQNLNHGLSENDIVICNTYQEVLFNIIHESN